MDHDQGRVIGFWRGWSIAVGCAVGSGIFMMPTMLAPYGLLGLSGWLIAGMGSILVALTMSSLVKRIPRTGGPYIYVNEGLGRFSGFIIAWTYWIACVSAIAGISIAFVGYLGFFIPQIIQSPSLSLIFSLVLVWMIVMLNIRSLEGSSKFQLVSTILKLLPLFFIIMIGFTNFNSSNLPEINPTPLNPISLMATVTTLVMWSFIGIETATMPADNVINPTKTIPKVLIASVITILVLYFLVSLSIASIVPADELINSTAPFNANTLTAGNLSLAAARDGLLPERFSILSKTGTPIFSYLLTGSFVSLLLVLNYTKGLINAFIFMAMLSTLSTLLAYAFCAIAELKFLQVEDDNTHRIKAMGLAFATLIYALFAIWGAGIEMVFYCLILIIIGMPIYKFLK